MENELNRLNVVSDGDESSLVVLDERSDVVESVLGDDGLLLLFLGLLLVLSDFGGLLLQSFLLLLLALSLVLQQQLE